MRGRSNYAYQLGADRPPYVLDWEAIAELKRVLYALAHDKATDPNHLDPDPATEESWKRMDMSEANIGAWDPDSAHEFALAVSRFKGYGVVVPGPWAVWTDAPTSGPQPTATGLELIAGAINTMPSLLVQKPQMLKYEAWRGGSLRPDLGVGSLKDGPSSPDVPIVFTQDFGSRVVNGEVVPNVPLASPSVLANSPMLAKQLAEAEKAQRYGWAAALAADKNCDLESIGDPCKTAEQSRDYWSWTMNTRRQQRDAIVMKAIALDKKTWIGVTQKDRAYEAECAEMGGVWTPEGDGWRCAAKDKGKGSGGGLSLSSIPSESYIAAGVAAAAVILWSKRRRTWAR